jgi:outer membrane protein assembly factor BamA
MLKRNVIVTDSDTPRNERITAAELNRYVQQSPNKRFLGTNLKAWLYAQADPSKTNGWNRMLRRMGEEPVVWNRAKTEVSRSYIETYLTSRGFFEGEAWYEIDTLKRQKVIVRYGERQGIPWRIASIRYDFRDPSLQETIMQESPATLLHSGDIFDTGVLDAERARIASNLKNRGYYNFDVGNITYAADSTRGDHLIDLTMVIQRHLREYSEDGTPIYEDNKPYRIKDIFVYPDYDLLADYGTRAYSDQLDTVSYNGLNIIYRDRLKIRPKILQKSIKFAPGNLYMARSVSATSAELMRLGAFRSASLLFAPLASDGTAESNTAGEDFLRCDIRLTPALRQSYTVDFEGSAASTFYGLRATLGYQNRNLLRGAELFDASLSAGFEFMTSGSRRMSYELGVAVGLTFPRFVNLWDMDKRQKAKSPETRLSLSANWQDRAYYTRALLGLDWGWTWGLRRFENFTFRPVDIAMVRSIYIDPEFEQQLQNPYLRASYNSQLIAGLSASYVFNNQPRDLNAGAVVLRANLETTGNLLQGLTHLFSHPTPTGYYNLLGVRFSQYVRGDVSFSQKIVLSPKTAFAYRLAGGAIYSYGNSSSPPIDKMFFAGGINSMRGWGVRTLGPGGMLYEKKSYPSQMGDVKLEGNVEFRFPLWNIFRGAVFCDVGNIWFMRSRPSEYPEEAVFHLDSFYKQLAFNTGLGLRLDIKLAVLRLDWGIQLHNPGCPAGERWIRNFKWANTALNFGVGYPF